MGYRQSSEVTSTRAIVLKSSQDAFSGANSRSEFSHTVLDELQFHLYRPRLFRTERVNLKAASR
jgi:hypothetical protein